MRPSLRRLTPLIAVAALVVSVNTSIPQADGAVPDTRAGAIPTPRQFFGFEMGAEGELARYPDMLRYFKLIDGRSDRLGYQRIGTTTENHEYALLTISSPKNLRNLDRLVSINRRLANPRGLSDSEARRLAAEGKPFYMLFASIHSTEVATGQSVPDIVHRLVTENSKDIKEILEKAVILVVPSQNPDGQYHIVDHWYRTKGTPYNRTYPDLYQKYTGHDNNRDWFMLTQRETLLAVEVQNRYKPVITHDMHQMGQTGVRMFVPPYIDPFDVNLHPLVVRGMNTAGTAMAHMLESEGKEGVIQGAIYDLWTPARMYMAFHGQPRILTEIATGNLADTYVNPRGADVPIGPQQPLHLYPRPYSKGTWTLKQAVGYGNTAAFAGMQHVARNHAEWLYNFYQIQRDWVNRTKGPFAFVVPADQRDPFAAYELLTIMQTAEVEIDRARTSFVAGGKQYPAGSYVIKTAQPFGAFAKTMLEKQNYPDLRQYPGGPPIPPYDVAGHTLPMLMGVGVDSVAAQFDASLERVGNVRPARPPMPGQARAAYLVGPESYGAVLAVTALQKAGVPVTRSAAQFTAAGRTFAPGTLVVAPTHRARDILSGFSQRTGIAVYAADTLPSVAGFKLKPGTRIGLHRGANNIPGGWMRWLFEQNGVNHQIVSAQDFQGSLNDKYDVIVLPPGMTKNRIIQGLNPATTAPEFSWAFGVGEAGWRKLRSFVEAGGTLLAIGDAVPGTTELMSLPIERVLPTDDAEFFGPGSLLNQNIDTASPIAWGLPASTPVFFNEDQAYRVTGTSAQSKVVSSYPDAGVLASGWLLGEQFIKGQSNVITHKVGNGTVVTYGTQVGFRTWSRGTNHLLFNAMYHGPATPVPNVADALR